MTKIATAVERSKNRKVANPAKRERVSATYVSLRSCPPSCPLRGDGCYAELGKVGITVKRLDTTASDQNADGRDMARAEARQIDGLTGENPLRLHVSGDSRTATNATIVARAADRYRDRHGSPVWSYTHAWRDVPRAAWGRVSILASVENLTDAARALEAGYAPAIVVESHPLDGKASRVNVEGIKLIPCPAQTRANVTCASCRLCFDADRLLADRAAITFAAHGPKTSTVKLALIEREARERKLATIKSRAAARTLVYQGKSTI